MKILLKKLDKYIDKMWRSTVAYLLSFFDNKKNEVDIDWLNMANNMRFDEKRYWEHRTKTYLEETKHIDKWKKGENNE